MLKRIILLQTLSFFLFNLNAQEKNNIKLGIDIGFFAFSESENLGLFLNVEPKLKVSSNAFIGLRIAVVVNSQAFGDSNNPQFIIDDKFDNGFFSIVPTFDYYLKNILTNKNIFHPYLGLGVGPYLLANYIDVFRIGTANSPGELFEVPINYQLGFLLRGGLEFGKLRFGLEYNFILNADIEIPNGQKIGTVDSSYLGLSFGLTI